MLASQYIFGMHHAMSFEGSQNKYANVLNEVFGALGYFNLGSPLRVCFFAYLQWEPPLHILL